MSVSGSIAAIAGAIAILAAVRAVVLARRLDDAHTVALSRTLVVHGAAVLLVGASAVLGGELAPMTTVLVALATGAWGFTWVLVGRSYDLDPERLEALRREERTARATPLFDRPAEAPEEARDRTQRGEPSRRTR